MYALTMLRPVISGCSFIVRQPATSMTPCAPDLCACWPVQRLCWLHTALLIRRHSATWAGCCPHRTCPDSVLPIPPASSWLLPSTNRFAG
jgi:hypothetical protein